MWNGVMLLFQLTIIVAICAVLCTSKKLSVYPLLHGALDVRFYLSFEDVISVNCESKRICEHDIGNIRISLANIIFHYNFTTLEYIMTSGLFRREWGKTFHSIYSDGTFLSINFDDRKVTDVVAIRSRNIWKDLSTIVCSSGGSHRGNIYYYPKNIYRDRNTTQNAWIVQSNTKILCNENIDQLTRLFPSYILKPLKSDQKSFNIPGKARAKGVSLVDLLSPKLIQLTPWHSVTLRVDIVSKICSSSTHECRYRVNLELEVGLVIPAPLVAFTGEVYDGPNSEAERVYEEFFAGLKLLIGNTTKQGVLNRVLRAGRANTPFAAKRNAVETMAGDDAPLHQEHFEEVDYYDVCTGPGVDRRDGRDGGGSTLDIVDMMRCHRSDRRAHCGGHALAGEGEGEDKGKGGTSDTEDFVVGDGVEEALCDEKMQDLEVSSSTEHSGQEESLRQLLDPFEDGAVHISHVVVDQRNTEVLFVSAVKNTHLANTLEVHFTLPIPIFVQAEYSSFKYTLHFGDEATDTDVTANSTSGFALDLPHTLVIPAFALHDEVESVHLPTAMREHSCVTILITFLLPPHTDISFQLSARKRHIVREFQPTDASFGRYMPSATITARYVADASLSPPSPPSSARQYTYVSPSYPVTFPFPDASMPFNVITLTSTLVTFLLGSMMNILIRKSSRKTVESKKNEAVKVTF